MKPARDFVDEALREAGAFNDFDDSDLHVDIPAVESADEFGLENDSQPAWPNGNGRVDTPPPMAQTV
jgi:hypothetical protein